MAVLLIDEIATAPIVAVGAIQTEWLLTAIAAQCHICYLNQCHEHFIAAGRWHIDRAFFRFNQVIFCPYLRFQRLYPVTHHDSKQSLAGQREPVGQIKGCPGIHAENICYRIACQSDMQLIIDKLNSVRAEIHQTHVKRMMASHPRFPSSVSIVGLETYLLLNTRILKYHHY